MPKSRNKKKKNPLIQVIKEPQFLIKNWNGQPMRVSNPNYGKTRKIIHAPQQLPKSNQSDLSSGSVKGWGDD